MAGMELPLLSPPTPDTQPAPVVRPQNEGFTHIAEAGGSLQHDAVNLWYMNRMARQDEQAAALTRSSDEQKAADQNVMTAVLKNPQLHPEEMSAFYRQQMQGPMARDLARYDDGPLKDRAKQGWIGGIDYGAAAMVRHATAEALVRREADFNKVITDKANLISLLNDPGAKAQSQAEGHAFIDQHIQSMHLPPEAGQYLHDQFAAKIWLGNMQRFANEDPSHFVLAAEAPGFNEKNAKELSMVGGIETMNKLIRAADSAQTLPYKQLEVRATQQKYQLMTQMDQAIAADNPGQAAAIAERGYQSGNLTQGDIRRSGLRGWEAPIPLEATDQIKHDLIDPDPKSWTPDEAYRVIPGTGKGSGAARARLNAYAEAQKKVLEDPLKSAGITMQGALKKQLFNPGFVGLTPERRDDMATFDKLATHEIEQAKSMEDLRKRMEGLRQQFAPKSVGGAAPDMRRRAGETDTVYFERIGRGLH